MVGKDVIANRQHLCAYALASGREAYHGHLRRRASTFWDRFSTVRLARRDLQK